MGLFSRNTVASKTPWNQLESIDQLNEELKSAHEKPILIFKHSTRCGISSMAIKSFENNWTTENTICTLYYLDLLKHRDVSNEIAQLTGVLHQSPQVIVIKGSEIVYSESHGSIDVRRIEQKLK